MRLHWSSRARRWLSHHRDTAVGAIDRLLHQPAQTLTTVLVLAVALVLPAVLYVAVANLKMVGGGVEHTGRVSVFISLQANEEDVVALGETLGDNHNLHELKLIPRGEAFATFRERSGFGEIMDTLEENPLPHVYTARLDERYLSDSRGAEQLLAELRLLPRVDDVRLDLEWLQRLQALLLLGERLVTALALVLGLGALLVVGNTISLAIQNRREEIIVVKLVGGTDAYVRRPFLYAGCWYGLCGGLLAWLLVLVAEWWLRGLVADLVSLYHGSHGLQGLGFSGLLVLAGGGALLGLAGSWLAVGRHLAAMEPG